MRFDPRMLAGLLVFVAAAQFFVGMLIAEALYPGYSISENYISDLGATCTDTTTCVIYQPTAIIFNTSVFLLGLLAVIGAYLFWRASHQMIFPILILITGIGAMGVGIFPETAGVTHSIVSAITFVFGGVSALWSFTIVKSPFRYLSVILGVIALVALVLYISKNTLGLGVGGMERMIVYPELLWALGLGTYLMGPVPAEVSVASTPGPPRAVEGDLSRNRPSR